MILSMENYNNNLFSYSHSLFHFDTPFSHSDTLFSHSDPEISEGEESPLSLTMGFGLGLKRERFLGTSTPSE
jgi:hypothetical protein